MCGPETPSSTPRVGARVDFFSPAGHGLLGNLLFLDPSSPASSHATHVRFQQAASSQLPSCQQDGGGPVVLVSIHVTGDLTKPLSDCGLMQQFTLTTSSSANSLAKHQTHVNNGWSEMRLARSLPLSVGHDGIIGRRVSLRRGDELLADGVVGFNFAPSAAVDVTASAL